MDESLERITSIRRRMYLAPGARWSFALAVVALGIGVFLWGTAYKVSLYQSSPIHNKVPIAKLSTLTSKANKDQVESATTPRNLTALPMLFDLVLTFFVLDLCSGCRLEETVTQVRSITRIYFPPAGFLRPPPNPHHG
jgi:hypothetical protein